MEDDTSQRLLDAAEALFAEHGFAETSLRAITTQAKANLAAVHYHFGSKDELLRAVFARRLKALNAERLARLMALETGGGLVTVEAVLAAFIEPSLRLLRAGVQGERFTRLLGLAQVEASKALRDFLRDQYTPVVERFQRTLSRLLPELPRQAIAGASWRAHGTIIVTRDLSEAAAISNRVAPEHLELCVADPEALIGECRHAGAIFLGAWTPEAAGDYVSGPNHVLPTSRSARFSSGLSVMDFLKRTTISRLSPQALAEIGPAAVRLAAAEGLSAHGLSVEARLRAANQRGKA